MANANWVQRFTVTCFPLCRWIRPLTPLTLLTLLTLPLSVVQTTKPHSNTPIGRADVFMLALQRRTQTCSSEANKNKSVAMLTIPLTHTHTLHVIPSSVPAYPSVPCLFEQYPVPGAICYP